jgi:hypothetical protein
LLAYRLVVAVKKFTGPELGFRSIERIPEVPDKGRFSHAFSVPVRRAPGERRSPRVVVWNAEVRVNFRRGKWARSGTFAVSHRSSNARWPSSPASTGTATSRPTG